MSAIDVTTPPDNANMSTGDEALRQDRQWLLDLLTAWVVGQQPAAVPGDPETLGEGYNVPFVAPGTPQVQDIYFTTTGLVYVYKAGPVAQLCGTLVTGSRVTLRQNVAPTGWTRITTSVTESVLRYISTGTFGTGGTHNIATAFTHSVTTLLNERQPGVPQGASPITAVAAHGVLKYVDVVFCSKD